MLKFYLAHHILDCYMWIGKNYTKRTDVNSLLDSFDNKNKIIS